MEPFSYRDGELYIEDVAIEHLAAELGTPLYVYSRRYIESRWRAYDDAFAGRDHLICYAVKANSNLAILNLLARMGSGFDIVSVGELERVLRAGGDPARIVFSGVGKSVAEMQRALEAGVGCFDVESDAELERLEQVAAGLGRVAPVSLRVNPDVDPNTHPYISTGLRESKFGIPIDEARELYRQAAATEHLMVKGIACHIGSQITEVGPFMESLDRVLELVGDLHDEGIELTDIDLGGGLGITYYDETPPEPEDLVIAVKDRLQSMGSIFQGVRVILEPGRSIVGNAGALITRIEYLKHTDDRNFAIVDGAMNDLMRPALYDAWQEILPVQEREDDDEVLYDIVGPVCETGDFLGRDRPLSSEAGDLLAVLSAGAYGFSMSSNYNSRPRAAEVLVDGDRWQLVRERESLDSLWTGESLLRD